MRYVLSLALAATLSLGIIGASLQPSEAGKRERRIAAGIALGLLGAAIIHKHQRKRHRYNRSRYYDYGYQPYPRYHRYPRYRSYNRHYDYRHNGRHRYDRATLRALRRMGNAGSHISK